MIEARRYASSGKRRDVPYGRFRIEGSGRPSSANAIDAISPTDEVEVFEGGDDLNGWKIIVTRDVIKQMRKLKEEKAPNETGGYLYGGLDETASEIYIVAASPEPPGTNGSPTNLELGPCGRTQFERNIIKKTSSRLSPLGSWHSHPRGAPTASTKDWFTLAKFRQDDKRYGQPTIIAITGTTGERFYVAAE
ncbi:MAG TPA: hypothetical protein EYN14_07300 [Alphaproteobacteria bacterium]|nr:hypothetical protein [Alphaproteobacteria bacterium]